MIWVQQNGEKEFQWVTLSRLNRSQQEWAKVFPNAHYNTWPIHYCDNVHYLLDSTMGCSRVFMTTVARQAATKIKIITTVTHMLKHTDRLTLLSHRHWKFSWWSFYIDQMKTCFYRFQLVLIAGNWEGTGIYLFHQSVREDHDSQPIIHNRLPALQSDSTDVLNISCHFILQKYWGVAEHVNVKGIAIHHLESSWVWVGGGWNLIRSHVTGIAATWGPFMKGSSPRPPSQTNSSRDSHISTQNAASVQSHNRLCFGHNYNNNYK